MNTKKEIIAILGKKNYKDFIKLVSIYKNNKLINNNFDNFYLAGYIQAINNYQLLRNFLYNYFRFNDFLFNNFYKDYMGDNICLSI